MHLQELLQSLGMPRAAPPVYERIGRTMMLGVEHLATPDRSTVRQFRRKLHDADVLLVEGSRRAFALGGASMEDEALRAGKPVVFLEDGCDDIDLAQRYGLSPQQAATYNLLEALPQMAFERRGTQVLCRGVTPQDITDYLANRERISPEYRRIDSRIAVRAWNRIAAAFSADQLLLFEAGKIFEFYRGQMRDHDRICPTVRQHMYSPERKGVVIGYGHTPNVRKTLHGEALAPMAQWPQWCAQLPEPYSQALGEINRLC